MVDFNFINGNPSIQERELIKEEFLSNLKEFRKEFEERATYATVNLAADSDTSAYVEFEFGDDITGRIDFINRFQLVYPPKGI